MVDITSLKVRLARLRLAGSKSKEVAERIRNRRKPIEEEEELQTRKATKDPYNEYTKNTGGKRKKVNKLTRSDQKRGKQDTLSEGQLKFLEISSKRNPNVAPRYYPKLRDSNWTSGDPIQSKRKKNNKLTRSDQKRGKKVIKKKKIKLDADDYVRSHTPSNVIKQGPDYYPDST